MKIFTRIEPTIVHEMGRHWKRAIVEKTFATEDGAIHEFTTFHKETGNTSVTIIAVTEDAKIITIYQFRPGPESWMFDAPGGYIEKGEDKLVAAKRKLLEETGYESNHWKYLGPAIRDCYMNAFMHVYIATGCRLSSSGKQLDQFEDEQGAELKLVSIHEFIENAKTMKMSDPVAVLMAYETLKEIQNNAK